MRTIRAAVIGSGISGLATSIRLASKGYSVTLFEKNSTPGGTISEFKAEGFRFETGPSYFSQPECMERLFEDSKAGIEIYLKYAPLKIKSKYFFPNRKIINHFADLNKLKVEIRKNSNEPFESILNHISKIKKIADFNKDITLNRSSETLKNRLKILLKKLSFTFLNLDAVKTIHSFNDKKFIDKDIASIFDHECSMYGSDPFRSTQYLNTSYSPIFMGDAYFPKGGMYNLVNSLFKLAKDKKVLFKFNTVVDKIEIKDGLCEGVICKGELFPFDFVITTSDINYLYSKMLKLEKGTNTIDFGDLSYSKITFFWGIKRTTGILESHNTIFGIDNQKEYELLSGRKIVSSDPSIDIYISSKLNREDAPEGCENWRVTINAPYVDKQDWNTQVYQARIIVLRKIYNALSIDLAKDIVYEKIYTPKTIERDLLKVRGALTGPIIKGRESRHKHLNPHIKNLYFAGSSVHPGAGIPMLLSGSDSVTKIASQDHPVMVELTLF